MYTQEIKNAFSEIGVAVKKSEVVEENVYEVVRDGDNRVEENSVEEQGPTFITRTDREIAVAGNVIPEAYIDSEFNIDRIRANLVRVTDKENFRIMNFEKYTNTLNGIISLLRMRKLPEMSYIIGAPNGFGKTSFVVECLVTMVKNQWLTVPYISLSELDEIRVQNEIKLMNSKRLILDKKEDDEPDSWEKKPVTITGSFSWSEYINAKCLFCFLSSVSSREEESKILSHILNVRGAKGLPTIVFTSTSLVPYTKDPMLYEYYWSEMLTYNDSAGNFDRMRHISCYKQRK